MAAHGDTVAVLVVDDQELFRDITRTLIAMMPGWRVVGEAASGEEGVALAEQVRPTMVLMDIHLPGIDGIDGIEATRRIVATDPTVTVLLMSTYAVEDLPADVGNCGAAGYARKDDLTPAFLERFTGRG
ncbi:response regulator transcription factor [Frankia sp. Cppng1_Ct_nod]|uniref:response regulator n=1 Tax=Frankia sp. Cppng1_Ct_nod TaxID=2897162 RepID=UPI00104105DD|nr:response regulator transcription factor [Frankia sp. Cppng1_Ct_nod]